MELAERATRLLEQPKSIIIEEPTPLQQSWPRLDPLTFILLLPFLPFYLLFTLLSQTQSQRRVAVTRIEKLPGGGYEIMEYER